MGFGNYGLFLSLVLRNSKVMSQHMIGKAPTETMYTNRKKKFNWMAVLVTICFMERVAKRCNEAM